MFYFFPAIFSLSLSPKRLLVTSSRTSLVSNTHFSSKSVYLKLSKSASLWYLAGLFLGKIESMGNLFNHPR